MNILVTGGTGFIGGHLVDSLLQRDVCIIVPFIELDARSMFVKNNYADKVITKEVDITNAKSVHDLITEHPIDYIIHLAAQTIVTTAYLNPYTTLNANIMGTVNLLEEVRKNQTIKGIIVASSDKAYGKTETIYTEDSPLKGDHPYDVSKSAADLICQTYFKTYNTPVVITRFGNVYGEGDLHLDRIFPGICQAVIKKEKLKIRSDGTYIRDYLYVKDVVDGYLFLLDNFEKINGEAFNFSSGETLSVLELIAKAEKILDTKIAYEILNTAKNEIPYQHLDDKKIKKLGWKQKYILEEGLKKTYEWYKNIFV